MDLYIELKLLESRDIHREIEMEGRIDRNRAEEEATRRQRRREEEEEETIKFIHSQVRKIKQEEDEKIAEERSPAWRLDAAGPAVFREISRRLSRSPLGRAISVGRD